MSEPELVGILMLTGASELIVKRSIAPLGRDRLVVRVARLAIQDVVREFLTRLGARVSEAARRMKKAAGDEKDDPAVAAAEADVAPLQEAIDPQLVAVAEDAARLGLEQVGVSGEDLEAMLEQVNEQSVSWAEVRAGELVTQVSETTRDRVRGLVQRAEEEGWSNDLLANELAGDGVFGDARAEMIARTETAMADVQGNLIGWKVSGVVEGKEWITSQTDPCEECAALAGEVVPLDGEFPGGDPPLHPRCECDVLPVLAEDAG